MKPVTIVKRFLNRTTPSIPLPGDIDEESASPSGTWLLVAQNTESPEPQLTPTTTTTACQTMASPHPFYETPHSNMGKNRFREETDALQPPLFRDPKYQNSVMEDYNLQPSIVLHPHPTSTIRRTPHKHPHYSKQQKNHCHHHPLFARLSPPYSLQLTKTNQILNELDPPCGISSTISDSHPNFICEIHNSAFIDQHINRIADSLGTGGLLMYIQVWNHWACWCHCHSHPCLWY